MLAKNAGAPGDPEVLPMKSVDSLHSRASRVVAPTTAGLFVIVDGRNFGVEVEEGGELMFVNGVVSISEDDSANPAIPPVS